MSMSILGKIKVGDLVFLDWSEIIKETNIQFSSKLHGWCEVLKIIHCIDRDDDCGVCPGKVKLLDKSKRERLECWVYNPGPYMMTPFVSVFSKTDDTFQEINSEIDELLDF